MHIEAKQFLEWARAQFPEFFSGDRSVLDVGSGDINGNNRYLFDAACKYVGNDVTNGPNVTIVSPTKDLPFRDEHFDLVISSECFEHDPQFEESIANIYRMLKPGGLFVFTCASTGRPEHGTRRTQPADSFGSRESVDGFTDHYKNITVDDLNAVQPLGEVFSTWNSFYDESHCDLFFWGVKRGEYKRRMPIYGKATEVRPTEG